MAMFLKISSSKFGLQRYVIIYYIGNFAEKKYNSGLYLLS